MTKHMKPNEKVEALARVIFERGGSAHAAFARDPISGELYYGNSIIVSAAEMRSIIEAVEQMRVCADRFD